jgi:hypothetical protein
VIVIELLDLIVERFALFGIELAPGLQNEIVELFLEIGLNI